MKRPLIFNFHENTGEPQYCYWLNYYFFLSCWLVLEELPPSDGNIIILDFLKGRIWSFLSSTFYCTLGSWIVEKITHFAVSESPIWSKKAKQ